MEERSLRIYQEKTFFSKISNTITKILTPTKIGINGMLISIKRNNALKAYEAYKASENIENQEKQEAITKKFEDIYALYLESIDKYIMDSIYKKVKNDVASDFEKNALSEYYSVVHLKETEYLEYKYKKQMYLLEQRNVSCSNVAALRQPHLTSSLRGRRRYLGRIYLPGMRSSGFQRQPPTRVHYFHRQISSPL